MLMQRCCCTGVEACGALVQCVARLQRLALSADETCVLAAFVLLNTGNLQPALVTHSLCVHSNTIRLLNGRDVYSTIKSVLFFYIPRHCVTVSLCWVLIVLTSVGVILGHFTTVLRCLLLSRLCVLWQRTTGWWTRHLWSSFACACSPRSSTHCADIARALSPPSHTSSLR